MQQENAEELSMLARLAELFDTNGFPPRWRCGKWSDVHGWTHIISDVAIFGAYIAIPIAIAYFVRRRTDVPFPKLFWLFSAFIMFCGFTHLIEATIFWRPWYRFSALIKVGTAIVSWATVIAMLPVIPKALRFRSPAELESEVVERTSQLAQANALLHSKNMELEQFIYTVSHDLKSPLVTTRGFLGALKEDLAPIGNDDVRDSIERIDRATSRMGELLEDLLELSRIGRVRNDPEWVDVENLLAEMQQNVASVSKPPAQLAVDGSLPKVFADPVRVRQVFDNLITNAVKYGITEDNRQITITGVESDAACEFRVIDHGPGIPETMREQVLLPFERLEADGKGTGVGLAIVARIVSVANGFVRIEETPGGGTTMVISFPKPAGNA